LNRFKPKVGDYLVLKINYKAIGTPEFERTYKDTITVEGKIRLKVRDSQFGWEELRIEDNRNQFYSLLHERPDTITRLNLYGCSFRQLPEELKFFTNLRDLDLEGNDLSKASLTNFAQLKRLKVLNLQDCNISVFPISVTQLPQLENLSVYGNSLTSVPDELYNVTSLRELNIGNNNLTNLSPLIYRLQNLRMLETSHTEIRRYPKELAKLKKLTDIYPSDTMIFIPHSLIKFVSGCDTILTH
jgi:Leucine-rich repeat (LRR) protein